MTAQTNIERTQALHAAFSENRYDDVLALAADDIEVVAHAIGQTFHGKEQFRQFFMAFKTAMPDLRIAHTNTVASDEQVAVEFVGAGTHTGPLMTPAGIVAASGRPVTLSVIEVHHWRDGKLSRMVNYQDSMALLVQVGAVAPPAGL
jgi:steroid delta-isomerase-like uncharacterized protein